MIEELVSELEDHIMPIKLSELDNEEEIDWDRPIKSQSPVVL